MTWVKICGITNLEDAKKAAALGVDALGFIFAPSKRRVEPEKVKEIIACLPEKTEKIGVFIDRRLEEVKQIAGFCGLSGLQFHGSESPDYCKNFSKYKIIKAFRVEAHRGWDEILPYIRDNAVDRILLDTYVEGVPGGTGKTFPWELVNIHNNWGGVPLIIAGGINVSNVERLIKEVNPFGIDVGSGVEREPGKKDEEKLKELMEKVLTIQETKKCS